MSFAIIGKRFSPQEFDAYIKKIDLSHWKPTKIVLHNTSVPSLAQRPHGFTEQHMHNLEGYYSGMGWKGGPHLFVDQNGIWVFNPLDKRGTHAPSWNSISWGVEMLGEYENEAFDYGSGLKVRDNTLAALVSMFKKLGTAPDEDGAFNFHKEDPHTTHKSCPGKHVSKKYVTQTVVDMLMHMPQVTIHIKRKNGNTVTVMGEQRKDTRVYADAHALAQATDMVATVTGIVKVRDFLGNKYGLSWEQSTLTLNAQEN